MNPFLKRHSSAHPGWTTHSLIPTNACIFNYVCYVKMTYPHYSTHNLMTYCHTHSNVHTHCRISSERRIRILHHNFITVSHDSWSGQKGTTASLSLFLWLCPTVFIYIPVSPMTHDYANLKCSEPSIGRPSQAGTKAICLNELCHSERHRLQEDPDIPSRISNRTNFILNWKGCAW